MTKYRKSFSSPKKSKCCKKSSIVYNPHVPSIISSRHNQGHNIIVRSRENQRESLCRQKMWLFSGVVKMWHEDLWVTVTSHIHSVGPSSSSQKDLRGNGRNIFWWGIPTRVIVRGFRCFTTLPCSYIKCGILTMWKPLPSYLYGTLKSPRFFPVLRTILIEFVLNLRKFLGPLAWKSSSDSSSGHFYVFLSSSLLPPLLLFFPLQWPIFITCREGL